MSKHAQQHPELSISLHSAEDWSEGRKEARKEGRKEGKKDESGMYTVPVCTAQGGGGSFNIGNI